MYTRDMTDDYDYEKFNTTLCQLKSCLPINTAENESINPQNIRFSKSSLLVLRKKFESSPYPTNEEYEELSCYLNTSTKGIRRWFRGERKRIKRKDQHSHQSKPCLSETRQQLGQKQMSHTYKVRIFLSKP